MALILQIKKLSLKGVMYFFLQLVEVTSKLESSPSACTIANFSPGPIEPSL